MSKQVVTKFRAIEAEICEYLGLQQNGKQRKGSAVDGTDEEGRKYEIKCEFGNFPDTTFLEFRTSCLYPRPMSYRSGVYSAIAEADDFVLVRRTGLYVIETAQLARLVREFKDTWSSRTTRTRSNGNANGFYTMGWIVPIVQIEGLCKRVDSIEMVLTQCPLLAEKLRL